MFDKDHDVSTQDKSAAPQTAFSAFTIFIQQRKPKIIQDNPNITTREVFKRLSEEFKNLSQYHKKMYEEEVKRRKQQRQESNLISGKRGSKDDDEPGEAKFQRTKLTLLANEEGFKIDPSDFPEKYGQAIEGLKKVIEDIKKMNLILNPITRNKALQKFLGNAASISCQFNGLLKDYPYLRDPYLKYTELEYNPDAHLQMLKKLATIYFQQKYQNSNLNINFYEKKPGELLGAAIGLSGKIEGKLNDKELIYYIKAHQHGARQRNNEYWLSVDPKEILIYLILYHCGFGEEVHFFYDQENKDVFFIATKDAGYTKCANKKKSYRTYKEIKSQIDTQNPSKIDKDFVKGLEEAEMIIRILRITNLISNPTNFGFVETVLKKKLKILDFRIPSKSITYSHPELYRSFLEGCGTQSRCTKSILFEKVCCHRQKEDRWTTGIRVLNRLKEGRGHKTLGFEEAVEVATTKTLEIFKMYERETGAQVVTHDLYNYKKCILKNFSVLYEKITQKL